MTRARDILNALCLTEAVALLPAQQWAIDHILKRFRLRLAQIPAEDQDFHAVAVAAMLRKFAFPRDQVAVVDGEWWMPFPLGWRILGTGNRGMSILSPHETIATQRVDNPFLSDADKTYWRAN